MWNMPAYINGLSYMILDDTHAQQDLHQLSMTYLPLSYITYTRELHSSTRCEDSSFYVIDRFYENGL